MLTRNAEHRRRAERFERLDDEVATVADLLALARRRDGFGLGVTDLLAHRWAPYTVPDSPYAGPPGAASAPSASSDMYS